MDDQGTVDVGDVRLAYQAWGDPDADPVVLLHALGEAGGSWAETAGVLAQDWRVYALDLRGHGESDWPEEYSFELMRDDVLGFLDECGLDRVALVGHSMGGVLAYLFTQEHPDRIERLVIEDAPAPLPREQVPVIRPDGPLPYDWPVVPAVTGQLTDPDPAWLEQLGEITVPTLVIAGGPDSHVSQDHVGQLAERIPDCRLITIPVGHGVHEARPREFAEHVSEFFTQ